VIEDISKYHPPFIDITSHAAEVNYEETPTGIKKKIKRKRPGTLGICALIQNKYDIDAVPHVLCLGFSREETEDLLIELQYLGIDNVLAIRGDDSGYQKPLRDGRTANTYAVDLVKQISDMNSGQYLEASLLDAEPSNFCIGVSGYPEKHFEAPNLKTDIRNMKEKIAAGAEYVVTQMFFNNQKYFEYVSACEKEGVVVPIIPGLKILTTKRHLTSIPSNFFVSLPEELVEEVEAAKPEHVVEVGVEWAAKQGEELLNRGVPSLHFYIMQNSRPVKMLMKRLGL